MDINDKIIEARTFLNIEGYPGNLFQHIINHENYIQKFELLLFKQDLGKTSGFIGYSSSNDPIICINYNKSIGHQNFTLAHEIGHLYLHNGISVCDGSDEIMGRNQEDLEIEAHQFAAELIYPKEFVIKDLEYINSKNLLRAKNSIKLGDYINELCKKYCISFSFALHRILIINNWKYNRNQKVRSVKNKIGKLSEKYDAYLHIVDKKHEYYKPYYYPVQEMKGYIEKLVKLEEISEETGQAIYSRNEGLERA